MTQELNQLVNDPNFVVQFAIGDPVPNLIPQDRNSGIRFGGVYHNEPKRFVLKKAHMSREDVRVFDVDTGKLVYVSHHPGKDPYDAFDPLGISRPDAKPNMHNNPFGGEWECVCDVTARGGGGYKSFRIRPKSLSRHGRQYIKVGDNIVMNVGKMGKFKTQSFRPHFGVGVGSDTDPVYKCAADMMGRTVTITNARNDEVVAQMAKTNKAMIQNAVLGSGSESTIDIAPGVDCSTILAIFYGIGQVGQHFVNCAFGNFVKEPLQDAAVDAAAEATGTTEYVDQYSSLSSSLVKNATSLQRQALAISKFFE